ncbi:uncharacterized protein FOMMEDRAFT_112970 [Fomitiporia mediterranea MF3/22]|uniref:uncharacterized protein n=1 Tax=Fomitiporia mediterranea (strain MF3/22) TaxID=694068 RepID=UPI0004409C73|nr:uncharacterized protein FOMMEDRAFT_112970 [Fomitiporia mediterranea MF3/22]EJC99426.1 hypothetical protein FOMMEDRAFT_112970 [Fomitiporia mediterranea MF3/22]
MYLVILLLLHTSASAKEINLDVNCRHVAKLVGMPNYSRHVGQALKYLPEDSDVPWQRVVSSTGKISSRGPGTNGAQRQREALEEEGVEVRVTRENEFTVNWAECEWFPEQVNLQPELETSANGDGDGVRGMSDQETGGQAGDRNNEDANRTAESNDEETNDGERES